MSSPAQQGPTPVGVAPGGGINLPLTPAQLQEKFDAGIWYALSLWPALHIAIQNSWGGPASSDKKDWFAGAISDLLTARPDTDSEELEVFLLQVMQDEFECNVEDESEVEVARTILLLKKSLAGEIEGDGGDRLKRSRELEQRWRRRGQMKMNVQIIDNEQEGDDEESEGSDDDDDVDMDAAVEQAPSLVPAIRPRIRDEPEVDEDGFTRVLGKKKR